MTLNATEAKNLAKSSNLNLQDVLDKIEVAAKDHKYQIDVLVDEITEETIDRLIDLHYNVLLKRNPKRYRISWLNI